MVVGVLRVELHIVDAGSLKAKRQVVKSLIDRVAHKFNVSVAEVDHQDLWQRTALGIAFVSKDAKQVEKALKRIEGFIESLNRALVTRTEISLFWPE
jgi:hypothetical protein